MSGLIDVVVVWGMMSLITSVMIMIYVDANFDNGIGRNYRPATCRTWIAMFLEAWIPCIIAIAVVIVFILGMAYCVMPYCVGE